VKHFFIDSEANIEAILKYGAAEILIFVVLNVPLYIT
jgi:hypothetical protein